MLCGRWKGVVVGNMDKTYLKINGVSFDVDVSITELEENFNVLDGEKTGRVMTGTMERDIIGTFVGHRVVFRNVRNNADFDALWDYLVAQSVYPGVFLEAADGQGAIAYVAYYTSGKRTLRQAMDGVNYWDGIEINFIPMSPQVTP